MRITIELPDELLRRAKRKAAESGLSLRQFFTAAIERSLLEATPKSRKAPPSFGDPATAPPITVLTPKQVDEAMFG
jgi:metal-responsive CopG/Arc/MetJ family transcriptional regulator